jgi:hypothetical protein
MPLLLAQKENREEMGLGRSKYDRKDDPHLWKGYNALFQQEWNAIRRAGITIRRYL